MTYPVQIFITISPRFSETALKILGKEYNGAILEEVRFRDFDKDETEPYCDRVQIGCIDEWIWTSLPVDYRTSLMDFCRAASGGPCTREWDIAMGIRDKNGKKI